MIGLYVNTPFNIGTQVDYNDYFLGNGVDTQFTLVNKTGMELGAIIQAGNLQFAEFNEGFTKVGNTFTLSQVVGNATIIAPGIIRAVLRAYDQTSVIGVVNPNISETKLYIIDPADIGLQQYEKPPTLAGIRVTPVDKDIFGPSTAASASWIQFAPNLANNTPGTYGAGGAALFERDIKGRSTLTANSSIGATSIDVVDGTKFAAGDFIQIDWSFGDAEIVYINSIASNTLNISPTSNAHVIGDNVHQVGWAFWAKLTLPAPVAGSPQNYFDIAIDLLVDIISRSS